MFRFGALDRQTFDRQPTHLRMWGQCKILSGERSGKRGGKQYEEPCEMARFGPFEFDAARRQVTRDGCDVHLTPKAFDLLGVLIEAAPRVVPKAELHKGCGRRASSRTPLSSDS